MNTYYLKKFRKKANEKYRVIKTSQGWEYQYYGWYASCEYDGEYGWRTEITYNNKANAYEKCDHSRRQYILQCVDNMRKSLNRFKNIY